MIKPRLSLDESPEYREIKAANKNSIGGSKKLRNRPGISFECFYQAGPKNASSDVHGVCITAANPAINVSRHDEKNAVRLVL